MVVAVGPWIAALWAMLGLPDRIDVRQPDGTVEPDLPMWTYWYLQEGEIEFDPAQFVTDDGKSSPVLHVDSDQTLRDDEARLITDEPWGVYFKPDRESVQGGAATAHGSATRSTSTRTRPARSSPASPTCGARRCRIAWAGSRACGRRYRQVRSGGAGAFTVDNFPVFDYMRPNVFVAADSNHGYKMIAVGREIARVLRRRALVAAAPVPLRAVRDRGPAPGLAQPVPLVITGLASLGVRGTSSAGHPCPADRRKCPDGVPGGRGDGPLGIRACLTGLPRHIRRTPPQAAQ